MWQGGSFRFGTASLWGAVRVKGPSLGASSIQSSPSFLVLAGMVWMFAPCCLEDILCSHVFRAVPLVSPRVSYDTNTCMFRVGVRVQLPWVLKDLALQIRHFWKHRKVSKNSLHRSSNPHFHTSLHTHKSSSLQRSHVHTGRVTCVVFFVNGFVKMLQLPLGEV